MAVRASFLHCLGIVTGLSVASVLTGSAHGAPAAAPPDSEIATLDARLLHAPDASHADETADRLEALRMGRLSATTRLLIRRAQREAGDDKLHDALGDLDDAVDLQPAQAPAWRERATVRALQGDADGAVEDLGGALSRDPTDILSWSALSTIEERRGRPGQAFEAWEHVLQLDPMIAGGAARLGALHRRMRGDPT